MLKPLKFAAISIVLLFAGSCSRHSGDANSVRLGFIVKQPEESWFQEEWRFAQQEADKDHIQLIKIGAPDGEKALSAIDNLAAQGAQGFVICTPDVKLGPAIMAKATSDDMKVFSVDDRFIGTDGKPMDVPYMGISATNIGRLVGTALAAEMKHRGWNPADTAACAISFDTLSTAKERVDGAIESLTAAAFSPNSIFHGAERTTDIPGAFDAANVVLAQHGDVKHWLVFSLNDEGVLGAVRAMEGRGFKPEDVIGIGIGGTTGVTDFEKNQPTGFFASVLLSAQRHGAETIQLLYRWVKDNVAPPPTTYTSGVLITRDNFRQVMTQQGLIVP